MARLAVVDASVLIAFLDADDVQHEAAVAALNRAGDQFTSPASVLAEVLVHPYRVSDIEAARIERLFAELPVPIQPVDAQIARRAAQLRARPPGVKLADALVLAMGDVVGADVVLTADARWIGVTELVELI